MKKEKNYRIVFMLLMYGYLTRGRTNTETVGVIQ